MGGKNQLTEGSISQALVRLAVPIMGTSFVQLAYNMTDMIWIGRVGSSAVAAIGTAGFFTWLAFAFILVPKIGAEVGVAQSVGREDYKEAKRYIRHTLQLVVFLALLYGAILILFRRSLIGFFNVDDLEVTEMAISYLVIVSFGMVFYCINPVLTGILNGYGNSKTPFMINVIGLVINMILDPIMILGIGSFPALGIKGAAIATVIAQATVTMVFLYSILKTRGEVFSGIGILKRPEMDHIRAIVKLGLPAGLQSGLFTIFAMAIARIVAGWGAVPIAVQRVGSQIEAISWMTAGGFSTALAAFVGQNYGAQKWERIEKGYYTAIRIMSVFGLLVTALLIFAARPIFTIVLPDPEAVEYGIVYLQILGLSQLFMCIEITTTGAFNGLGRTVPPSIVGIAMNFLRIPSAYILSSTILGLSGIWWSISMSSVFKGIILTAWFIVLLRRQSYKVVREEAKAI